MFEDAQQLAQERAARFDRLLLVLCAVLALGGSAVALVFGERRALDDPVQQGARGEVVGAQGISLARAPNLARAVAAVNARLKPDEQVTSLRLSPVELTAIARDTEGDQRSLTVDLRYAVEAVSGGTSSSPGPSRVTLDPAAPGRIVAAARRRFGYAPDRLDYLVYEVDGDPVPRWDAFFVRVPIERNHLIADRHGRRVGLPGEPGAGEPIP